MPAVRRRRASKKNPDESAAAASKSRGGMHEGRPASLHAFSPSGTKNHKAKEEGSFAASSSVSAPASHRPSRPRNRLAVMIGLTAAVLGGVTVLAIALRPGNSSAVPSPVPAGLTNEPSSGGGASATAPASRPSDRPTAAAAEEEAAPHAPAPSGAMTRFGSFHVVDRVPHRPDSFTQGFCLHNGTLYEGTGLYGQSAVQIVDVASGEVLVRRTLQSQYFGEGLAYYKTDAGRGRLVQITWKEQTGFVYDAATLELVRSFAYSTSTSEGWGITARRLWSGDGTTPATSTFLVTDGSSLLLTWNRNFTEVKRVPVTLRRRADETARAVSWLNELEWDPFTDTVYANVWQQNALLRVDPDTGFVRTIYDLTDLYPPSERDPGADVLNGIAVTDEPNVLWVTGKLWPYMYKIRLLDG